ncbi:Rha family transcriptional regulator [Arsenophonus apicola]|uniref:Rha family transcriptional regulator n=1 Tax=Arsenophonus apicola TaxID=2879119 RepID=UPI001CDB5943|nr:Rha family transcriptional regulator [Arsenophonus apicola]UBX30321.1 Rha family transcriptional regulator [Arsenophonus apicola]
MNNQLSLSYPEVIIHNDKVVTTSMAIADYFQKAHDNVLKKIRSVIADCDYDYHVVNFNEMFLDVEVAKGAKRKSPYYQLTRDGFVLIAMGFTGKKALQWKINYINAFNRMETELNKKSQNNLNFKAIVSVENGNVVSVKELHDDEFVTTIDSIAFIAKKSGYIFMHSDEIIEKLAK